MAETLKEYSPAELLALYMDEARALNVPPCDRLCTLLTDASEREAPLSQLNLKRAAVGRSGAAPLAALLEHVRALGTAALARRSPVYATQALSQPDGKINGGLMLFGRYWLHNATQAALEARGELESREQSLLGGFFAGHLALLPKRFNVEMRFWDAVSAS